MSSSLGKCQAVEVMILNKQLKMVTFTTENNDLNLMSVVDNWLRILKK